MKGAQCRSSRLSYHSKLLVIMNHAVAHVLYSSAAQKCTALLSILLRLVVKCRMQPQAAACLTACVCAPSIIEKIEAWLSPANTPNTLAAPLPCRLDGYRLGHTGPQLVVFFLQVLTALRRLVQSRHLLFRVPP
jgi:hypothetical protein